MSKQDRQGVRTPADVERKYKFGERFAEVMGVATDAREAAEEAAKAVGELDGKLEQDEIFNRLTDNGKVQGIYREDGLIYINASYIKSGKIAADYIDVASLKVDAAQIKSGTIDKAQIPNLDASKITTGTLSGKMIDGATLNITEGATIAGWTVGSKKLTSGTLGSTSDHFVGLYTSFNAGDGNQDSDGSSNTTDGKYATIAGERGKNWRIIVGNDFGVDREGAVYATSGRIGGWTITSSYLANTNVRLSGSGVGLKRSEADYSHCPWTYIYNTCIDGQSDLNVKNSISSIDDYDAVFDNLKPCRYKYNHGTSGRYHTGFIAQEVASAVESAGLTTRDFAGVIHLEEPDGDGCEWLLRRDEFVALNTWQIQKLKQRVASLEAKIETLQ